MSIMTSMPRTFIFTSTITVLTCIVALGRSATAVVAQTSATPAPQILYITTQRGIAAFDPATHRRLGTTDLHHADGIAADAAGDLYVIDDAGSADIIFLKEFVPGKARPVREFGYLVRPGGFAVSPVSGDVAIASSNGDAMEGSALVFYEPQHVRPALKIKQFATYGDLAYDAAGNLWVEASGPGPMYHQYFGYVPPGGRRITIVPFRIASADEPLGFDRQGRFVVFRGSHLDVYDATGNHLFAVPLADASAGISGFAFSPDGTTIFTSSKTDLVRAYPYPAGGASIDRFGWYATGISIGGP